MRWGAACDDGRGIRSYYCPKCGLPLSVVDKLDCYEVNSEGS